MNASTYQSKLDTLKGVKLTLESELSRYKKTSFTSKREKIRWERTKAIINDVGLKTQQQLQFHVSNLTSMAMEAVFDDPYEVKIKFVPRRGKTECDIWFERNGNQRDPLDSSGFGSADIASFALRVAALSMNKEGLRRVLLLDEPFKHLSTNHHNRASEMMKEISERLNIQIIMITHSTEFTTAADRIFKISKKRGISSVHVTQ